MHDVFRAGVGPGGLTADYELKIMLCYILDRIACAIPVSALIEVLVSEQIGNYFETASACSKLVESGQIEVVTEQAGKCCRITESGRENARMLEKDLPVSVRERALEGARKYLTMQERRAHNKVETCKVEDGYLLTLTISDVGSDLLSLTILLPDRKSCDEIERRFMEDPVLTYKGVVAVLTGSIHAVGELLK